MLVEADVGCMIEKIGAKNERGDLAMSSAVYASFSSPLESSAWLADS